jgi:large subunit ribosomal protein L17
MVTPTKGARLGSSPAHERLIIANLATSLFEHGSIKTTFVRAKRLRPHAERLITVAKRDTLAARRQIMKTIRDKSIVHLLMTDLAEQFKDREGGYTRIIKVERRKGDQAEMAIIELVQEPVVKKASAKKAAAKKATSADKEVADIKDVPEAADDTTVEDAHVEAATEIAADIDANEGTTEADATAAADEPTSEEPAAEAEAEAKAEDAE